MRITMRRRTTTTRTRTRTRMMRMMMMMMMRMMMRTSTTTTTMMMRRRIVMMKRTFSTELNQPTSVRYDQIPETARMFRYFSLQILPDLYSVSLFDTWKSQGFQRTSIVLYIRKHFLFGYILIYIYSCDGDEVLKGLFWGVVLDPKQLQHFGGFKIYSFSHNHGSGK